MSDFDLFLADCPARTTLALVGDTWSVVVIMALGERPRRYSELLERIGGISKKMLTLRRCASSSATGSSSARRPSTR
jgi:DNA-binding HxlR family transcriptional regulator